jgi:trigger factor
MDQYLNLVGKSREEYLAEIRPDAERRVKRQLVLEEISQKEKITVEPEEIEALLNAYAQMGQELPHSENQLRSLAFSYRREKALSRLVELTTDPDTEEVEAEDEASIVNAQPIAVPSTHAADPSSQGGVANAQTSPVSPTTVAGKDEESSVEIETER